MSYIPPDDDDTCLVLGELKKEKVDNDQRRNFEFDPNRLEIELINLLADKKTADPQSGAIKFWSNSALKKFQECPYAIKLRRIDRIKEDYGTAADRGNMIHDQAEAFVKSERDELPEAKKIKAELMKVEEHAEEYRCRLMDIGWLMRCLMNT